MQKLKVAGAASGGIALLIVAAVAVNIIASRLYVRLDVTQDKVFSLSPGTKEILGKLDRDVVAKLYFSRSMKDLPVMVKTYATRVEEMLNEYKAYSHGRLTVEVIDPRPDTDDEEWAQRYGLSGVRLPRGEQMYFGVVFAAGSKEEALPYLDPRREELLEYDLSQALVNTAHKEKAKVGVMSSLAVAGAGGEEWAFLNDLRRNFQVEMVPPDAKDIDQTLRALIVIHPKGFSDATQFAIDQYVLGGGRLIAAVDPMSRVDLQQSAAGARAMGQMPDVASDLNKLFAAWGIEFDKANLVGDVGLATQINAGGEALAYPFFMSLHGDAFTRSSVVTGSLREMLFAEGGAFSPKKDSPYTFEPLIKTTKDSGTAAAAMAGMMMPGDMARTLKADGQERVLAALVHGKFKTAFPQGRPPDKDSAQPTKAVLTAADKEATVIVIGDVDFLSDQNSVDRFRFGSQVMARARNDNLNFLVNATDFLAGNEDLIQIRSRGHIARPFTRVAELQKNAQLRWQAEDEKLTAELNEMQKKLNDLQQQRTDGNRFVLSAAQQGEIAKFREEERRMRTRRREVRRNLREDIEALGRRLMAANMLILPLATTALGVGVFSRRARRHREATHGE